MGKVTEESMVKNMAFLIQELQKEWAVSKEVKKTIVVTVDEAPKMQAVFAELIATNTGVLDSDTAMTFKESMKMSKENYILLRLIKKAEKSMETARTTGASEFALVLDKEEAKLFREVCNN